MKYDFYAEMICQNADSIGRRETDEIDEIVEGKCQGRPIPSIAARIQLLTSITARNERLKDYAVSGDRKRGGGYKRLVHDQRNPQNTKYAKELITSALKQLRTLELEGDAPDVSLLPPGSWFLQFTFTLAKPWISKDDEVLYVAESVNPVRKEKVFKVPMMSASSWKGMLRWTLMHIRLAQKNDQLTPEDFAKERLAQTLLFGDEQGEELTQAKGFAAYLDNLKPEARPEYERLLRKCYGIKPDETLPHHRGRLIFYPSFFNAIGVEVINPHSRETKAGTHPIYLECVPAKATATFSLLYTPLDRIGKDEAETRRQVAEDMALMAQGLQDMFTVYGFGAKTSSGFGLAEDGVENGTLAINVADFAFPQDATLGVTKPDDVYSKYLDEAGRAKPAFSGGGHGGLMSNREYKDKGGRYGGGSLSEFKRFRQWYVEHGERWQESLKSRATEATHPTLFFQRLAQLTDILNRMGGAA